ncbi:MAG: amidohydrolase [Lachnospiraceae bacterium]|nr:amidohydrolase [Lachnospiraceae bacterium]
MRICLKNARIPDYPGNGRTDIYINGSRITAIGKAPRDFTVDEIVDCSGKTVLPGLINCHTHAYMSIMRSCADDLPFQEWLFEKVMPIEDTLTPEDAYWGNMLSIAEMIRTGTTTFVDMQMFPRRAVKACKDSGMRAVITRGLVGQTRDDEAARVRLEEAFDEMRYGADIGAPCMFGLGPHAIYTCGEDLLRYVAEMAAEKDMPVNIHLTESQYEYDTCIAEHGMTPVEYLDSLGLLDRRILLAHCVYLSDSDFSLLRRNNVHVALNPASNMKLANGFAPADRMLREGINLTLGTDGAASNNALNLFLEMRLLALSQKGAAKDAVACGADDIIRMVTENGARAIGREDLGKVEAGKTADLILIDENQPNLRPIYNIKAALVYAATGAEVSDVLIGGKFVMRNRELTTIDEERVIYEAERIADRYR